MYIREYTNTFDMMTDWCCPDSLGRSAAVLIDAELYSQNKLVS